MTTLCKGPKREVDLTKTPNAGAPQTTMKTHYLQMTSSDDLIPARPVEGLCLHVL